MNRLAGWCRGWITEFHTVSDANIFAGAAGHQNFAIEQQRGGVRVAREVERGVGEQGAATESGMGGNRALA